MHALQVLGTLAVIAAFASCAFDNGSLRWALVALVVCAVGTVIEFALGAWPLGLAAGALSIVAGCRGWRRLIQRRIDARALLASNPPQNLHPHV
ncbi:MAG: hypothetical protein J0I77_18025 [Rudaea sp.]|uniref:hypothetical protein n=1 Tax=unclassified Rudaea TaxID=2627037 RepID=UPI0010F7C182|nr:MULTISPECIES: hypothetical protein [unclassified Rudaea]MBN8887628.1 hypothetical protein [Rudaea sp.]MBR0346654.1 hypothetical protein [Rudaea sp.]